MQEEWVSPTFHWLTLRMDYVRYAFEQVGYEGIPEGEFGANNHSDSHLWSKGCFVALLFKAMDMVALNARGIKFVKAIGPKSV